MKTSRGVGEGIGIKILEFFKIIFLWHNFKMIY